MVEVKIAVYIYFVLCQRKTSQKIHASYLLTSLVEVKNFFAMCVAIPLSMQASVTLLKIFLLPSNFLIEVFRAARFSNILYLIKFFTEI